MPSFLENLRGKNADYATDFNEDEIKAYQVKKTKMFKGTIAVCAVYGGIALMFLLLAAFNAQARTLLSEIMLPFTITFVALTVIIIILLLVLIMRFKPKKLVSRLYDGEMCPDYWKLEKTDEREMSEELTDAERSLMTYKCVPDPKVFNTEAHWNGSILKPNMNNEQTITNTMGQKVYKENNETIAYVTVPKNSDDAVIAKLDEIGSSVYYQAVPEVDTQTKTVIQCDKVFPAFISTMDEADFPNAPNSLRCKYANMCGISWSSVCPDA